MTQPNEDFDQAAITLTLKGGSSYADPWAVLRGSTAAQAQDLLRDAVNGGLLDEVAVAAAGFQNTYRAAQPADTNTTATAARPPLSGAPAATGPVPDEVVLHKAGFKDKDAVKALGGRWNPDLKAWTVKPRYEPDYLTKFAAYL